MRILAVLVGLIVIAGMVSATEWSIESYTTDLIDKFEGSIASGTLNYGLDTTETDPYNNHEVAKISKRAVWSNGGWAKGHTKYTCPKVCGTAKYGVAEASNMLASTGSGTFNTNVKSNYKLMDEGAGNYPDGWFSWAKYGIKLSAQGEYEMGTAIYETADENANNHFDYYMAGDGTGEISYGHGKFNSGPNWGDGYGDVSLSRWEYNWAKATGSGIFIEDLGGDDYLENQRFKLPGGGTIVTEVHFNDGMDKTPIWMTAH